jgi:hypothetical protein
MKNLYSAKFVLLLLIISISIAHCAKKKEEIKKDLVIQLMTSGRWLVQNFSENSTDVSNEFINYEFQFFENGTVQAINGSVTTTGTWVGDANALTIYSNFVIGSNTILRLNETWKITNNTLSLVEAIPANPGRTAYLKLVKK